MTAKNAFTEEECKPASGSQILDELRGAKALVAAKATTEEAEAYGVLTLIGLAWRAPAASAT